MSGDIARAMEMEFWASGFSYTSICILLRCQARSCRSLRSASLCQGEIFLSCEAEGACWLVDGKSHLDAATRQKWSERGWIAGRTWWLGWWKDASSHRYYRPVPHIIYARTYARKDEEKYRKENTKLFELDIDFVHTSADRGKSN